MQKITELQPSLLWQWFQQICDIPHPSFHEQALAEHIVRWAEQQGLWVERDRVGNILIRKGATKGMENRQKVALQAHLDMVPQKNATTTHDFTQDPIRAYVDGEWVKADGTTLGADNGIGLASALAVLASDDLAHPELEVLLTMTEETGMVGAKGLQPDWLKSDILINTDTEEEGEIYIGCAGGIDADMQLAFSLKSHAHTQAIRLNLTGLQGGHSGCDIHTNRANAIKLLARILAQLQPHFDFQLADIQGGSLRNAIPREASAVLVYSDDNARLEQLLSTIQAEIGTELALIEPNFKLDLKKVALPERIISEADTDKVIDLLNVLPNGVIRYSDKVKGVVETSLSVGVLSTAQESVSITILIRSLTETGKFYVSTLLDSLANLSGAEVNFSGDYSGWEPDTASAILPIAQKLYQQVLGREIKTKVIHAGLECGIIKKSYPQLDMISIGPTIRNAHSPDEKVSISAVQSYWQLLTQLLANIPVK